jgi:hypothetical protein
MRRLPTHLRITGEKSGKKKENDNEETENRSEEFMTDGYAPDAPV